MLIEQVKSQSLAAGFEPETFTVFEYASPPLGPASPRRNLVLGLSGVIGLLLGCGLALTNAMRRGVYFTESTLLSDVDADLALKSKSIRRISRSSISNIISVISKHRMMLLNEAEVKLAKKKLIYVFSSGGRTTASGAARLLATQSAQSGRNVIMTLQANLKKKLRISL